MSGPLLTELDQWILARRPAKERVDPWQPAGLIIEPERTRQGTVEETATLLIVNRECPFRCLMCDLWRWTTDERVPDGAVLAQLEAVLPKLEGIRHLKLYNAGNFFDAQAIPPGDRRRIADRLGSLRTVIVECHPRLVGRSCFEFHDRLSANLDVAMGLETVHPDVLPRLNKQMTLDDFARATDQLVSRGIAVRAFILLRPPYLGEEEGIDWAVRSIDFAFRAGVECAVVIPTRAGNGALDELSRCGSFAPPRIKSLESVIEQGLRTGGGRVFADLWDIERFVRCPSCDPLRIERLRIMNHTQTIPPAVTCPDCGNEPLEPKVP